MSYPQKLHRGIFLGLLAIIATAGLIVWAEQSKTPPKEPTFYDKPDPYDLKAIAADPSYYQRVVPSRVWQQAPVPAGQVRHEELLVLSRAIQYVPRSAKLAEPIRVKAKPNRPVTFTALDAGRFANGKLSITVPADENGYAQADFWVGDMGDFRILAGSPENQGPAEINLQSLSDKQLEELKNGTYAKQYWTEFNRSPHAAQLQQRPHTPTRSVREDKKDARD